ncbi:MAG: hypothetical protein ASARMPRED_008498 [Alectoria sarmentosa]|nr:MAG: hypothetical protein ASARMPRED_008498 [Alectoria sarmentosa]
MHGSRAVLSRHFKSHTTRPEELSPFTHPSCWDQTNLTAYPPSKQDTWDPTVDFDLDVFRALPVKKQRAINAKIRYALAGVENKKQLQQKEEHMRLRFLHWWFRANEESLRARMEFGPEGLFPRKGENKLPDNGLGIYVDGFTAEEDSLLELAIAPPVSQLEPLPPPIAPTTQADQLIPDPDQAARSVSAQTGWFDYEYDRSLGGSVIADFELASTRPLTSVPLLWCMSNSFVHFVKARGENLTCAVALKRAAEVYLRDIDASQDLVDGLNLRFDRKHMGKYARPDRYVEEDKWIGLLQNERCFRRDRAFIWGLLEKATNEYFYDYYESELPVALGAQHSCDAVKVVVKATRAFARVLGDARTAAYIKEYWTGRI